MWRYLVGMVAGVLLVAGGVLWWRNSAVASHILPAAPRLAAANTQTGAAGDEVPEPPAASVKTREEKRFGRYDHDKNGAVSRDEFLMARRKAFAKLDANGDGVLSFDEYAVKTEKRFADADADRSGALTAPEFATTRIARKTRTAPRCAPVAARDEEG